MLGFRNIARGCHAGVRFPEFMIRAQYSGNNAVARPDARLSHRLRRNPRSFPNQLALGRRRIVTLPDWLVLKDIFSSFVGTSLALVPTVAFYYLKIVAPNQELSKEQYVKRIMSTLQKKYKRQHRRALEKLPIFQRSDNDEMVKILQTPKYIGKIVLIEGYSGSGKTTVMDGLLDGRSGVVSIALKEKAIGQRDAGVRIVSDVLDCRIGDSLIAQVNFNTLLGYWEESVDSLMKSNPKSPPLVWIDDLERGIDRKSGRFYPEFESFLSWLGSISDRMIVVLSGPPGLVHLLRSVSGFSTRLLVHSFPTLDSAAEQMAAALQKEYHLSADQAKVVLSKLGTSLDDIGDFLTAKIDGLPFETALDSVIDKGSPDVFDALIAKSRPVDIAKQDWIFTVFVIFRGLAGVEKLNIDSLLQELPSTITLDTVLRVVDILVAHHILTFIDQNEISYRALRFRPAFARQLETEWIKTYLKNHRVNVATGTLN